MKKITRNLITIGIGLTIVYMNVTSVQSQSLWDIAKNNKDILTVTTLFTAQDVRDYLSDPDDLDKAVNWCKQTGLTKVYMESFGRGYYPDREKLVSAKNRFLKEGFEVSGCVTTTNFGKPGVRGGKSFTGMDATPCYSNKESQEELQRIFEYSASIFDEIMIDDFFFTSCECEECITARGDQTWSEFYCDLMLKMSRERILKPAKTVNPNVKVIIKYPLWYDNFHNRGYDVVRESRDYDKIYVGTETRDVGEVQYGAYFIMRWLGGIGGDKTGGGWFDTMGTTPNVFLEQARQTVLAGAKELMMWSYGQLIREIADYGVLIGVTSTSSRKGTGIANVNAFRKELPGLFALARLVRGKPVKGIHLPKLPNSDPFDERHVYSSLGMLGLPLVPAHEINEQAESAIFPVHMLKEPGFPGTLERMLEKGKPVVVTDGLAKKLTNQALLKSENLTVLKVEGAPKNLLNLTREELKPIRDKLLAPMGLQLDAPNKVGLYLFGDNYFVVENFNDEKVDVTLDFARVSNVSKVLLLPEDGKAELSQSSNSVRIRNLSPRTLVAVEYR